MDQLHGFLARPFHRSSEAFGRKMREIASGFRHMSLQQLNENKSSGKAFFDTAREDIAHADFLVADFSLENTEHASKQINGNVLTEAGIALGLNKAVYIVARAKADNELLARIPSDWKGFDFKRFGVGNHADNWDDGLRVLFQNLLNERNRDTALVEEQSRTGSRGQYLWLLRCTTALQMRLRQLARDGEFDGQICEVKAYDKPERQAFDLKWLGAPALTVQVEVYLRDGPHVDTPFILLAKRNGAAHQVHAVRLDGVSAYGITTSQAVEKVVSAIAELTSRLRSTS